MRPISLALVVALGLAFAVTTADAQQGKKKESEAAVSTQVGGFLDVELRLIKEYFASHTYQAEALPPGIAKNLARGKPLPPGIAKKQLPAPLATELPAREGLEISIFGDRIVLLEASGLVVDVISGIF